MCIEPNFICISVRSRIKKMQALCALEYFSTTGSPTLLCTSNRSKAKHSMAQTILKETNVLQRGKKQKRKKMLIKLKNKIKSCPFSYHNKEKWLFSKEKLFFLLNKTQKITNQSFPAFFQVAL